MSFHDQLSIYRSLISEYNNQTDSTPDIIRTLNKKRLAPIDLFALLAPAASDYLEIMAQKAALLTRYHFGNTVILFTPMYLSNYCTNVCPYCSFAQHHNIHRNHLTIEQITHEAEQIAAQGIRHVLLLTGESPAMAPISYLEQAITAIKKRFALVAIEIYPLTTNEYARCCAAGTDALTLYQETYDETQYRQLHAGGPKEDFLFRLDAPERACQAGMRSVTIGALYGLHDWRSDAFFTGIHAAYLQKKYPGTEIGISFPRLRPQSGSFSPHTIVSDRELVQMLTALRIFLPSVSITMSTRESASFRMNILPCGVTKMSAGVSTSVGGHTGLASTPQFEIADTRNVATIRTDLLNAGFQPVFHDWNSSILR